MLNRADGTRSIQLASEGVTYFNNAGNVGIGKSGKFFNNALEVAGTGYFDKLIIGTSIVNGNYRFPDEQGTRVAVGGKLWAEEVEVRLQAQWPDYVFREEYDLRSLEELRFFLEEHNHLPGLKSAQEMEDRGGQNLGEQQRLQLEKLEEAYRYILQLEARIGRPGQPHTKRCTGRPAVGVEGMREEPVI
mgnify:CR=1 FL=1